MFTPANLIVVENPPEAAKPATPFAQTLARQIEALRSALLPCYAMADGDVAELNFRLFAIAAFELSQIYAAQRVPGDAQ